jgi:hypothetical protein
MKILFETPFSLHSSIIINHFIHYLLKEKSDISTEEVNVHLAVMNEGDGE